MQIREDNQDRRDAKERNQDPPLKDISRVCRSVKQLIEFYTKVIGFALIERPKTFDFDGAGLFNYSVGIHLVQCKDEEKLPRVTERLDPMDNHISFQSEDMEEMERKLKNHGVNYMKRTVGGGDGGVPKIDQLFFKDPDTFMIEICNCENLKLRPKSSMATIKHYKNNSV